MKTKLVITGILAILITFSSIAQDARAIIKKADDKSQGSSNKSVMSMSIVRPKYTRTIEFKNWSLGLEYFMTYITAPAKDKGQVFMKHNTEMWSYSPSINRMIKLPPSMMSQGWMGSDYSNDDLVKQSSIVTDYDQKVIAEEEVEGRICYKIEMIPNLDANVVWGKVIYWVDKELYIIAKGEYYDEEAYLVRTEVASGLKKFDGRELFSKIEIIPAEEEGNKTVIEFKSIVFNVDVKANFFSQQNMKRIR